MIRFCDIRKFVVVSAQARNDGGSGLQCTYGNGEK